MLREIRKGRGISQQELADAIHVSRSTVAMWETGSQPSPQMLETVADFFNVSIDFLTGRTNDDTKSNCTNAEDQDLWDLREELRRNPEMRTLFDVSKNAKPNDLRRAIKIIEALKDESENRG